VPRSRPKVVQKLLDLGLVSDRAELRKKRKRKDGGTSRGGRRTRDDGGESGEDGEEDAEMEGDGDERRRTSRNTSRSLYRY